MHGQCDKNCINPEIKFKNGLNCDEVTFESQQKILKLRKVLDDTFFNKYELFEIFTCHEFKNFYVKHCNKVYKNLNEFYLNCDHKDIVKFRLYFFKKYVLNSNTILNDLNTEKSNSLINNSFIMAKIDLKNDDLVGYNAQHFCKKCHLPDLNEDHNLRLMATNASQNYVLYHVDYLKFLIREKNAFLIDITHVFLFSPSDDFKIILNRILDLRFIASNQNLKVLSTFCKNLINTFIGFCQIKSYKINCKTMIRSRLDYYGYRNSTKMSKVIINVKPLMYYNNKTVFILKYLPKKKPSAHTFYFKQSMIAIGTSILSKSKLDLMQFLNVFQTYLEPEKFSLLNICTDSFLLIFSEKHLLNCLKYETQNYFLNCIYPKYFSENKNTKSSIGKLIIQDYSTENFMFISPHSRCYTIIKNNDENLTKGLKKYNVNTLINTVFYNVNNLKFVQKDRLQISINNEDSVPF